MLLHTHQYEAVAVVAAAAVVVVILVDSHEAKIVYNFQCGIYQTRKKSRENNKIQKCDLNE